MNPRQWCVGVRRFCSGTKDPVSYLYTGRRGNVPFTVEPNLDFRDRFEHMDQLKSLINHRKLKLSMSIDDLAIEYAKIFPILKRHRSLTNELTAIKGQKLKENEAESSGIKSKIDSIKHELKTLNFDNEKIEGILLECLKLPNNISIDTPIGKKSMLIDESRPSERSLRDHSHFMIGTRMAHLKKNPDRLYLTGAASELYSQLEESVRLCFDKFGFRSISPSYFLRSSIVEGLEVDCREDDGLRVGSLFGADGRDTVWGLNLAGHGLGAYLALLLDRRLSHNNCSPIVFCSVGTTYKRRRTSSDPNRWFLDHFQRPVATVFVLSSSEEEAKSSEAQLISNVDEILKSRDINWKRYKSCSEELKPSEMKRFDWLTKTSPAPDGSRSAYLASYGDFLSKRLRCTWQYSKNAADWRYIHCSYAEIDLYTMFAALVEQSALIDSYREF